MSILKIPKHSINIILKYPSFDALQSALKSEDHDDLMTLVSKFAAKTGALEEYFTNP